MHRTQILLDDDQYQRLKSESARTALNWVPVSDEIADRAGAHARSYRRSHPGIGVVDVVIAATVEHLGAALWTHNVRHYPMFADLVAPY